MPCYSLDSVSPATGLEPAPGDPPAPRGREPGGACATLSRPAPSAGSPRLRACRGRPNRRPVPSRSGQVPQRECRGVRPGSRRPPGAAPTSAGRPPASPPPRVRLPRGPGAGEGPWTRPGAEPRQEPGPRRPRNPFPRESPHSYPPRPRAAGFDPWHRGQDVARVGPQADPRKSLLRRAAGESASGAGCGTMPQHWGMMENRCLARKPRGDGRGRAAPPVCPGVGRRRQGELPRRPSRAGRSPLRWRAGPGEDHPGSCPGSPPHSSSFR